MDENTQKNTFVIVALAALLLASVYFYYMYNVAITVIFTIALVFVFNFYKDKPGYELQPDVYKKLHRFLFVIAVILLLIRFYKILSFPFPCKDIS